MKFVKFLRAPDFKEHLRTTACEFKPVRCIVFIKAMANITSRGKVSFNYLLYLITPDLILQSYEIFSPAIVSITVLGNEEKHYHVML